MNLKQNSSEIDIAQTKIQNINKKIVNAEKETFKIIKKNNIKYLKKLAQNIHPLSIARNLKQYNITNFDQKTNFTYEITQLQKKLEIYTLDRFLKNGSNFSASIMTPNKSNENECIIWCTNLYLGLNRHPQVLENAKKIIDINGVGCGTSAVSGGFSSLHNQLESEFARFFNKEAAILFPTGFTTNLGVISAIADKHDLIIFDKECHSSIIEGVKLSGTNFRTFKNNDANSLEQILKRIPSGQYENIFVITESVYGMSGEEAPLKEYCKLKEKYKFYLYVDEAHSFGFYGEKGNGLSAHLGCLDQVDFIMTTLSKAIGSIGGIIACKKEYATFIRHTANSYLFQASLPSADITACLEALNIIQKDKKLKQKLWSNTNKFRNSIKNLGFNVGKSSSPIVPIYIDNEQDLATMCKELFKNGVFTNWISYPAVKKGKGRLRFIVSAGHTEKQINFTIDKIEKIGKNLNII